PRERGRAGRSRTPKGQDQPRVHGPLPRGVAQEVRSLARPGKGEAAVRLLDEAVSALGRERPGDAAEAAAKAKSMAPRSGAVREVLGMALYRTGRFREALTELQAYRRLTGRLDQNHLIADCHRALGSPEKAVAPAREAATSPRLPEEVRAEAAVVGASALADLGRFDEALSLLRRHPGSGDVARPHDIRVWYVLADVLERSGRRQDAVREFRRILRHDPEAYDVAERLAALA
ncbi:MAG TPA: tetratricopeptide repeat protein, partial [Actinomycetota bacterium]|nr:tetratricopeptide repeat protein [Actinomycetota bacterium]